jgi:hypothetical protein
VNAELERVGGRNASGQERLVYLPRHTQVVFQRPQVVLPHARQTESSGGTPEKDGVLDRTVTSSARDLAVRLESPKSLLQVVELGRGTVLYQRRLG